MLIKRPLSGRQQRIELFLLLGTHSGAEDGGDQEVPTRGSEMESSDAVRLTETATDDALT